MASAVWRMMVPPVCWSIFSVSQGGIDWIRTNILVRSSRDSWPLYWRYIFRQTVRELWMFHTCSLYGSSLHSHPYGVAVRSLRTVLGTLTASVYG